MPTDQKEKTVTEQTSQTTADREKEQPPQEEAPDKITRKEHKRKQKQETETESDDVKQQQEKSTDKMTRKQQKQKQKQEKRENKKPRRRIFPIWLRIIVVLVLSAVAMGVGLIVGYGVIGDGNPTDALEWETWQHIIDIVVKEE